jgi:hypothetical protein
MQPQIPCSWQLSILHLQYAFQQPGAKANEAELHSWVVRSGAVHSFQLQTITANNFEDLRQKFRFIPLGTTSASKTHYKGKLAWNTKRFQTFCDFTCLYISHNVHLYQIWTCCWQTYTDTGTNYVFYSSVSIASSVHYYTMCCTPHHSTYFLTYKILPDHLLGDS